MCSLFFYFHSLLKPPWNKPNWEGEEKKLESDREKGEYKLEIWIMRAGDEKEFKE